MEDVSLVSETSSATEPVYFDARDPKPDYFVSSRLKVTEIPGKDLGVVATGAFQENELVECCPAILIRHDKSMKWGWLKRFYKAAIVTVFDDYLWWYRGKKQAILLGYGNLYNHSKDSNVVCYRKQGRRFVFVAKRAIKPGEEVTVDYGYIPFCFEDAESKEV